MRALDLVCEEAEMEEGTGKGGGGQEEEEKPCFWTLPLPHERIFFVDSPDTSLFSLFLVAMEEALVVGMDAEWKPVPNAGVSPRISILQIACRIRDNSAAWNMMERRLDASSNFPAECREKFDGDKAGCNYGTEIKDREIVQRVGILEEEVELAGGSSRGLTWVGDRTKEDEDYGQDTEGKLMEEENEGERITWSKEENAQRMERSVGEEEGNSEQSDSETGGEFRSGPVHDMLHLIGAPGVMGESGYDDWRGLERQGNKGGEVIFLLDMLALQVSAFGAAMKKMLSSPRILKLGFAFKQDLLHLTASFPGPEGRGCFDKVEPYIDIGKLYRQLRSSPHSNSQQRRRKLSIGGQFSLVGISTAVLGVPLCKDSQCSNWEQRPLTLEQIEYAAADAYCLLSIFDVLLQDVLRVERALKDEEGGTSPQGSRSVGLAELLNFVDKDRTNQARGNVYVPKRGIATAMVRDSLVASSISCPRVGLHLGEPTPFHQMGGSWGGSSERCARFVKQYAECLLINGPSNKPGSRRRPRGRRAREALKDNEAVDMEELDWMGPAPWEAAASGDGLPKFLCDVMVEGLARQLRCVGVDAASPPDKKKSDPRQMVEQAEREGRVLLTRDIKLLRRRLVPDNLAYRVRALDKWEQLAEVIEIFKLNISEDKLLSRCVKCNGDFIQSPLSANQAAAAASWIQVIPESALTSVDEFWQCAVCHHIYWQGFQFVRALEQFTAICQTVGGGSPELSKLCVDEPATMNGTTIGSKITSV